jgi:hypothetical protein
MEIADIRARADYCFRWAAVTSHPEMRVLWKTAAEAWEAAAYRIGLANSLIRQLEANRDPLVPPPAAGEPASDHAAYLPKVQNENAVRRHRAACALR